MSTIAAAGAVALAAGIVEGKSVIDNFHQRQHKENLDSTSNTFIPSIMYGVVSLPLTAIGASPSVYMIQANLPPIPTETDGDELDSHSSAPPRRRLKLDPQEKIEMMDISVNENSSLEFQMKQMNIQRARAEKRQALASKSFTNYQKSSANGRSLSTYIATLDGKPLPTPLAEGMRRVRILACSYGLVSLALAYQLNNSANSDQVKEQKIVPKKDIDGRDPMVIQNFVENCKDKIDRNQNNGGVAMRLFSTQEELDSYIATLKQSESVHEERKIGENSDFVLPIITSNVETNSASTDDFLHWTLGNDEHSWNQIPIDSAWFFQNDTKPILVLESNISDSFHDSIKEFYNQRQSLSIPQDLRDEVGRIQKSILDGKKIRNAAVKKNDHQFGIFHVFIGSGINGDRINIKSDDEIYLSGLDTIGHSLLEQIKFMQSKAIESTVNNDLDDPAITSGENREDNAEENPSPIVIVEGLGKYIRQSGLTIVQKAFRGVVSIFASIPTFVRRRKDQITTIHVFCDKTEIEEWLDHTLLQESGIKLVFYKDQHLRIEESHLTKIPQDDIILFLCSTDTATINVASSVISYAKDMKCTNFLTVVESLPSKDTLGALTRDDLAKNSVATSEILSVASIYEEMFAMTRKMLTEGKSTGDIKDEFENLYR